MTQETKRSTLADANEARDWRIHAEFAQRLIEQARKLYVGDSFGIELDTAYALYLTTIDLCLSLFPWALFRTTKSAVKMHTLLDLRGNIPSFIHISDGKAGRRQCARHHDAGARCRTMSFCVDGNLFQCARCSASSGSTA